MIEKILNRFGYHKIKYYRPEIIDDVLHIMLMKLNKKTGGSLTHKFSFGYDVSIYERGRLVKSIRLNSLMSNYDQLEKIYNFVGEEL